MTPIAIEHVDPRVLVAAGYNPRTMDDDAKRRLRRGIEQFGLVDPLIVRREDNLVIGGHQRLAAALDLELRSVPVVYLDVGTQDAALLNVLLNNPYAQGEWDFKKLAELLSTLDAEGADATLTGFDEKELERMMTWTPDAPAPDPAPPTDSLTCPRCGMVFSK